MHSTPQILITLGILLFLGLLAELVSRKIKLPRITLLLIGGFVIGPSVIDILPIPISNWFHIITNIALAMVAFLLGGKLEWGAFKQYERFVLWISASEVIITFLIVFFGLVLFGIPFNIAALLASISTATAPGIAYDIIREQGVSNVFTKTLEGVVAIDDIWSLIIFSIALALIELLHTGHSINSLQLFLKGGWEIFGAIGLGASLGIPIAYLTGHLKEGEPTLIEALGAVLLCCGIALWIQVSFLLASITMGIVITNLAEHHARPFHAIEGIEWPFIVLFFILAGASLQIKTLLTMGFIGVIYILLRITGRLIGGWLGGKLSHAHQKMRRWIGAALIPQGGVALGMTMVAIESSPELSTQLLPIVLGSTVLFELAAPVFTRLAVMRTKDIL